jgi:predicted MFS family arabinose efflux permease
MERPVQAQPIISERRSTWRAIGAGLGASFLGIGLARFAYTPLIPALIAAHWFAPAETITLGAANLAGYLVGALLARSGPATDHPLLMVRAAMLLTVASLLACAWPVCFTWFFSWRLVSGITGGLLMVLAPSLVMNVVPAHRRGFAAGALFTGIGLGLVAAGRLIPLLLPFGLTALWCMLAALGLLVTLVAWPLWPDSQPARQATQSVPSRRATAPLAALYLAYALNAIGIVPHMVFLVDFVARGLGRGLAAGAADWVYVGLGAIAGPIIAGKLADHIGFGTALRLALAVQAFAISLVVIAPTAGAVALSSLLIGACLAAIVPLALGRVHEFLPADGTAQRAAWSLCTAAFALGQAAGGALFSALFAATGRYPILFEIGFCALVLALVIDCAATLAALRPGRRRPESASPV